MKKVLGTMASIALASTLISSPALAHNEHEHSPPPIPKPSAEELADLAKKDPSEMSEIELAQWCNWQYRYHTHTDVLNGFT